MNHPAPDLIDAHTHVGVDLMFYLQGNYPYALDWPTLVRMGEAAGIGRFVVFPMVTHLVLNVADLRTGTITDNGGLESVPYEFENRRMMREIETLFPELQERAFPLWMLDPSRKQKEQVAALKELAATSRCSGLKIQATIIQSYISDLLKEGECLLDYAEENNLPVLIHTSVAPSDPWSPVADIIAVAEARPGIRFNLAHSCRFDRPTLDRVAELDNTWSDCSAHRIHCLLAQKDSASVAAPERRFPSDYRDPDQVLHDLAEAYPDKLLWGSDAPFDSWIDSSSSLRSSYDAEAKTLHSLAPAVRERVARQNTLAFLQGKR